MKHRLKLSICLAVLSTGAALAQTSATEPRPDSSSPVAFVYVSRPTHIDAFAAATDGKLTPVPGSPFSGIAVNSMSVNKDYLFGGGDNGNDIYSFSIASDGVLKQVSSINVEKYNPDYQAPMGPIAIDSAGKTVYVQVVNSQSQALVQSYKVEANGSLQYLGDVNTNTYYGEEYLLPPNVIPNDKFAYQAGDVNFDQTEFGLFEIYRRESNGLLTSSPAQSEIPAISGDIAQYYADAIATDPGNHLAVAFQPQDYQFDVLGPDVLATYTAESNGDLNTASTYKNMPASDIYGIVAASISPSGKLLAVGGQGFQILHFNGSSPITHYSALLQPNYAFQELGWDNENHLYALSYDQLFVYTVTPTSIKEAPGSPYSIPEVSSIIVLSK